MDPRDEKPRDFPGARLFRCTIACGLLSLAFFQSGCDKSSPPKNPGQQTSSLIRTTNDIQHFPPREFGFRLHATLGNPKLEDARSIQNGLPARTIRWVEFGDERLEFPVDFPSLIYIEFFSKSSGQKTGLMVYVPEDAPELPPPVPIKVPR